MASQTQGIQQLLAAEKRATEKVAEARRRKYFVQTTLVDDTQIGFIVSQYHLEICILSTHVIDVTLKSL